MTGIIRFSSFAVLYIFLIVLVLACSDSGTNPQDKEFVLPDSNLTFVDDVGPLLLAKCGSNSGCHNPSDKAGGLDLTQYQNILLHMVETSAGAQKLVLAGDGANSFLYRVLLSIYFETPRMPFDGPYLNKNNSDGIRIWIDEGLVYSNE